MRMHAENFKITFDPDILHNSVCVFQMEFEKKEDPAQELN